MLESTEIGDNDVLTDIIGVPSGLNPDASNTQKGFAYFYKCSASTPTANHKIIKNL